MKSVRGASPRGRRNPHRAARHDRTARCISAWAEEPGTSRHVVSDSGVHLRVGGGTRCSSLAMRVDTGASPRGRRNLRERRVSRERARCISAWAEEPRRRTRARRPPRVHLRVGGGTREISEPISRVEGASPRGRRNQGRRRRAAGERGCISAWAEEPRQQRRGLDPRRVHLRVGGGTDDTASLSASTWGASPRGRRNPSYRSVIACLAGCISAWAEEPARRLRGARRDRVHLRVGGGTCSSRARRSTTRGASPRGRRNR